VVSANSTYFFNLDEHFRKHYADRGFGREPTLAVAGLMTRAKKRPSPVRGGLM
jgi:hypothetical protein